MNLLHYFFIFIQIDGNKGEKYEWKSTARICWMCEKKNGVLYMCLYYTN